MLIKMLIIKEKGDKMLKNVVLRLTPIDLFPAECWLYSGHCV